MKREIKFKAWNGHSMIKSDSYVSLMYFFDAAGSYEIMQYTGLKDKHGNEIYEGDILKTLYGIRFVVFDNCGYAIKNPIYGCENVDYEFSSFYLESEVIGNIHETPQLLNQ